MSARVLEALEHRPWPLPERRWIMAQSWRDLLFAHWRVPPHALRPLVPRSLALDTHEGEAWVGVVPFRMTGVRLRWMPPVPGTSAFPELNVRTYVVRDGRPGVWFFSLDAASRLAVRVARAWFHLPYFDARMRCERSGREVRYESRRTHPGAPPAELRCTYRPTEEPRRSRAGALEHWLTERYCLYAADRRGRLYRGEIHHPPWPLRDARAEIQSETTAAAAGIALPDEPPLLHFADRIDVVAWAPRRVG